MARTKLQLSLIAIGVAMSLAAQAQAQGALNAQRDAAVARLEADSGGSAQVALHSATGTARFVRAAQGGKLGVRPLARAFTDAAKLRRSAQFLADYGSLFGVNDVVNELGDARVAKDRYAGTHVTHKQFYRGLPVFGAELKTHFDAADNLTVVNGAFVPGIAVDPNPTRSAEDAIKAAIARVQSDLGREDKFPTSKPTLMIYREGLAKGVEGANHLAWYVEVGNRVDVRQFVVVSAHTGKVIEAMNGIHDAKNRRAFDAINQNQPGPNYPGNPFWVEGNGFPTGNTEADNMISASSEIYDLFKVAFGRDSFDGQGATMDSIFNRGNGCPNASWNGQYISFCPGTTTDDITAHEWGHAYTEYTHGLIYAWQPGALNESYSDIWGETVDRINGRGGDAPDLARTTGVCAATTAPAQSLIVNSPAGIAGLKNAGTAAWGPQTFTLPGTLQGVEVGSTSAACAALPANSLTGKIAFIERGTCGFSVKALNAQNAGAVGVVIGNNVAGTAVLTMGITAGSVPTIPSLSVSGNDGTAIKANLSSPGVTVTMSRAGVPSYNTVRWLMGEDSAGFGGAIRDMYNPTCAGNPGKVSDAQYSCGPFSSDNGGVHNNSGVPNHAYALLVDGGTYNSQSISGIGLTKAAHIYYRAQSVYQGPTSNFADHADAIEQSCRDLTGVNLAHLKTGLPSGEVINAADCAQVAAAALAVELRSPPAQCNFQPLLAQSPPALCPAGNPTLVASDAFDGGKSGGIRWLVSNTGTGDFPARNWGVINSLPSGRAGYGIFASDLDVGTCAPGGDAKGMQRLESQEITIPAGTNLRMAFDHSVATEADYDGGNVKISVNGGAWTVISAANFVYNPYNTTLITAGGGNSNPLAGQPAFSGTDAGSVLGKWGRSIINLAPYAAPGDKIKLRFELGYDGCGGVFGWYLDDVKVYQCTAAATVTP